MSKIKFQLWDNDAKVMRDVLGIDFENNYAMCKEGTENFHYDLDTYDIRQFIGVDDKSDLPIYIGDVVSEEYFSNVNPNDHDDEDYIDNKPRNFVVCFDSKQAKFKLVPIGAYTINAGTGGWTGYELRSEKVKIIGNIYENTELLK